MPVWLSLFVAVVGTVGFFFGLYFVVISLVEGKRAKGKPRLGIGSGSRPGSFAYWVTWDTGTYNVQILNANGDQIGSYDISVSTQSGNFYARC